MINSMTGFGSARVESEDLAVSIEVKSVNHRYLDVHMKLPPEHQSFEALLRQRISSRFKRGRVDVFVRIDVRAERVRLEVNQPMVAAYAETMRALKAALSLEGNVTVDMISRIPGLVTVSGSDLTTDELQRIEAALKQAADAALNKLAEMRAAEGHTLTTDMRQRLAVIRSHRETILSGANGFVDYYRQQLLARVQEIAPQISLDSARLETEALMYAERSDIAEETTRLGSHLQQFDALLGSGEEAGKKMDFLLQEMNRETTTILSKTSGLGETGSTLGKAAIEIKMEIEKLREQVQNIE